jgi:hypothetical protein
MAIHTLYFYNNLYSLIGIRSKLLKKISYYFKFFFKKDLRLFKKKKKIENQWMTDHPPTPQIL